MLDPGARACSEDGRDVEAAVDTCLPGGVNDLWVWSADAGAHMSSLRTVQGDLVWAMIVDAFAKARSAAPIDS